MKATISGVGVEFPGEEHRCVSENRVGFTQFTVPPLKPPYPFRLGRGHTLALTAVNLRLAHRPAQRFSPEPESRRHHLTRGRQLRVLIEMIEHEPDRSLLRLLRNPRRYDQYLLSILEKKRHQTGDGSATIDGFSGPRQAIKFSKSTPTAWVLNSDLTVSEVDLTDNTITATSTSTT